MFVYGKKIKNFAVSRIIQTPSVPMNKMRFHFWFEILSIKISRKVITIERCIYDKT